MINIPNKITDEEHLEELLSRPSPETVSLFSRLNGDIMFLGIAGKIGPSIAEMAKRSCDLAGVKKRIIGVSRFSSPGEMETLQNLDIEIIRGDLLNKDFINTLPKVENVFFLAGMKFGSEENLPLTWAVNSYMPGLITDHFRDSRIVAFSTGCVYSLVSKESGGSRESDIPGPVGEYAQSCLGRERMFEFGSRQNGTKVTLIRLNYAVELRYGVLVDIATKVKYHQPIDLSMGYFNVIWQGDVNEMVLRSVEYASTPAKILNITGEDILSARSVAEEFGMLFGTEPIIVGKESDTALLNNAAEAFTLFGRPKIPIRQVMIWIAEWIKENRKLADKPTHYEVRDGKY